MDMIEVFSRLLLNTSNHHKLHHVLVLLSLQAVPSQKKKRRKCDAEASSSLLDCFKGNPVD
jgi:hypothetical protein